MKPVFLPNKTLGPMSTMPVAGSYMADVPATQWYKCREQFAEHFKSDLKGLYFSIDSGMPETETEGVTAFIAKTEEILDFPIAPEDANIPSNAPGIFTQTKYAKTNRTWCLYIEPSTFWKECPMKRSLFTILLRCGRAYSPERNNYEAALYSVDYARNTKLAVERFLFGYTKYICDTEAFGPNRSNHAGWYGAFSAKDHTEIRKQLVRPPEKEPELCLVAAGSLWG